MTLRKIKEFPERPKHQLLGYISIIILIALLFIVGIGAFNLQKENTLQQTKINDLKEQEWQTIVSILNENEDKATIQVNYLRDNIQKDLLNSYSNNMDQMKSDILYPTADSRMSKVFADNLNGKYLNVNNDNNDLFVINMRQDNGGILYDKSINCSKNKEVRTWQVEKSMHYNKVLFEDAKNRLIAQNSDKPIFWEFLTSKNSNHYQIKYDDINELKKVFLSEGIDGIKSYEILVPAYIKSNGVDIFNTNDVSNIGENQNSISYKLAVVQGFNIVDELNLNHKTILESYNNKIELVVKETINNNEIIFLQTFSLAVVMLLLIFGIFAIQNKLYDEERGENLKESNFKE